MFRRRSPLNFIKKLREIFWPSMGWGRYLEYVLRRLSRLKGDTHSIALGTAIGIFASFTPFLGLHIILAGLISWFTKANIIASVLGTAVGNPLSFPLIWLVSFNLGYRLLGRETDGGYVENISLMNLFDRFGEVLLPWLIGGTLCGLLAAVPSYYFIFGLIESYKRRKRRK